GNLQVLEKQIEEFRPAAVAVSSHEVRAGKDYALIKERFGNVEFIESDKPAVELALRETAITVSAIVGAAGLEPSLAALKGTRRLALANKETLVMAGNIFMAEAARLKTEIIPIDSEHSAIFSLLGNTDKKELKRIIITASGGSLRSMPIEKLPEATPESALAHPTWSMGKKITIDSATLMNKGFEVIEAHHLFDLPYEKIDVVIHPESIVHAMIEMADGAVHAHMSVADMAIPILNAIKYPNKINNHFGQLDFTKAMQLNFLPWDASRYPALALCYKAGRRGGTMPAVLNAANEVCVEAFINGKISFTNIAEIVERTVESCNVTSTPGIDEIFEADRQAREISMKLIRGIKK
ncbi:MAG: 1-deoxy-D-xylulose-5-phosphate reductoisomerase, partial [Leptospirales bacterium]|nr:1-deoxy-D-xylulose-5-phosphate reductoisomerase [Leptospirales bacterium]